MADRRTQVREAVLLLGATFLGAGLVRIFTADSKTSSGQLKAAWVAVIFGLGLFLGALLTLLPPLKRPHGPWARAKAELAELSRRPSGPGTPNRMETMYRSMEDVAWIESADQNPYHQGDPIPQAEAERQWRKRYGMPGWWGEAVAVDGGFRLLLHGPSPGLAGWKCEVTPEGGLEAVWTDIVTNEPLPPRKSELEPQFPYDFTTGPVYVPGTKQVVHRVDWSAIMPNNRYGFVHRYTFEAGPTNVADALGRYFEQGQKLVGDARVASQMWVAAPDAPEMERWGPVMGAISRGTEWFQKVDRFVRAWLPASRQAQFWSSIDLPSLDLGFTEPHALVRCFAGILNRLARMQEIMLEYAK